MIEILCSKQLVGFLPCFLLELYKPNLCAYVHTDKSNNEKDTAWSWTDIALSFLCFSEIKSFFRYNYIVYVYFGFFGGIFKQLVFKKHSLICNYINFITVKWLLDGIRCFFYNKIIISREIHVVREKWKKKEI